MDPAIIPKPRSLVTHTGSIPVRPILRPADAPVEAAAALRALEPAIGEENSVGLSLEFLRGQCDPESYRLVIGHDGVRLYAGDEPGFFYAAQTLRQLLFAAARAGSGLPLLEIEDSPRFSYRGFMFDSCRHFFGIDEVKRLVDLAAAHKLNVFHWHLTEDQGWRIESLLYPRLTELGSRRGETRGDGIPHGGFYSRDDVREVVAYAAERRIEVIPEFDLPGHVTAALAAYPQLGCTGGPYEVATRFGIWEDILCAGNDDVLEFLRGVLGEICELFPGRYVHIGGDEAPKARWRECPRCQARIRDENLAGEEDLQAWLMNRAAEIVESHGKTAIAWNDGISSDHLASGIVQQFWMERGEAPRAAREANGGRRTIVSDYYHYYLDYPYGMTSLAKTYGYDPVFEGLERPESILGVEAPLWTEYVADRESIDRQVFPRLTAMAETGWSGPHASAYADFRRRLSHFYPYLESMGASPEALGKVDPGPLAGRWQVARFWGRAVDRKMIATLWKMATGRH
jgi:hexosaminidase